MLTDTHCHVHEVDYPVSPADMFARANDADVTRLVCVGTDEATSQQAVEFAQANNSTWATVGLHPHDATNGPEAIDALKQLLTISLDKIVAIGECGLDYFYDNSPRKVQLELFEAQLQLANDHNLPLVFHVREAFEDFWPVVNNFPQLRGVVHSFTDNRANLEKALAAGLYIGVNGISLFSKDEQQKAVYDAIPEDKLLFETDAPFLTPPPHRGKVNEPAFVRYVAEYHAERRRVELEHLARVTSANASTLFSLETSKT